MDGDMDDQDGWCFPSPASGTRNLVLMGGRGNGKSATGNTILGTNRFKSKRSLSGVTSSSECHNTTLPNGEVVNVIDTPGLFFCVGNEIVSKEIVKGVDLAKDGVDAVLLVFSFGARFTEEEATVLDCLQTLFGPKIIEYIIVVFTGGDEVEEDGSLSDFLNSGLDHLQKILQLCNNRIVLFDNKTKDPKKKESQLQKLFSIVDNVAEKNNGHRFSYESFKEMREPVTKEIQQEEAKTLKGPIEQDLTDLMKDLTELMNKIQISCGEQIKEMEERVMKEIEELQKQVAQKKSLHLIAYNKMMRRGTEIKDLQRLVAKTQRLMKET